MSNEYTAYAKISIESAKKNHKPFKYQLAAESILADCFDRRGIKNEFRQIDKSVLDDIVFTWQEIIRLCIEEEALSDI